MSLRIDTNRTLKHANHEGQYPGCIYWLRYHQITPVRKTSLHFLPHIQECFGKLYLFPVYSVIHKPIYLVRPIHIPLGLRPHVMSPINLVFETNRGIWTPL